MEKMAQEAQHANYRAKKLGHHRSAPVPSHTHQIATVDISPKYPLITDGRVSACRCTPGDNPATPAPSETASKTRSQTTSRVLVTRSGIETRLREQEGGRKSALVPERRKRKWEVEIRGQACWLVAW